MLRAHHTLMSPESSKSWYLWYVCVCVCICARPGAYCEMRARNEKIVVKFRRQLTTTATNHHQFSSCFSCIHCQDVLAATAIAIVTILFLLLLLMFAATSVFVLQSSAFAQTFHPILLHYDRISQCQTFFDRWKLLGINLLKVIWFSIGKFATGKLMEHNSWCNAVVAAVWYHFLISHCLFVMCNFLFIRFVIFNNPLTVWLDEGWNSHGVSYPDIQRNKKPGYDNLFYSSFSFSVTHIIRFVCISFHFGKFVPVNGARKQSKNKA